MMDGPTTYLNPLFIEEDEDPNNYVTKNHFFSAQRALHQENEALNERIDLLATNLQQSEQHQETTLTKSFPTKWRRFVPCWSTALLPPRHCQAGAIQAEIPRTHLWKQVIHELVHNVAKTMKRMKLQNTHSMEMVYKPASANVNNSIDKLMIPRSKSKLQYAKINKAIKMAMTFNKRNTVVKNKPLKPNMLYVNQPKPSMSATAKYVFKKRPSNKSDKKKPHALRSAKYCARIP